MAFLTLNGNNIRVQTNGAVENEPTYAGESARAFDDSYRSGLRAAKRTWTFTLASMPVADLNTLKTLIGLEATLTATGEFIGGATISVVARLGSVPYIPNGTDVRRVPTITLIEK